jgi:hypothetical protein
MDPSLKGRVCGLSRLTRDPLRVPQQYGTGPASPAVNGRASNEE